MYTLEQMILLHNGPISRDYMRFIHYVDRLQKLLFDDDFDLEGDDDYGF